MWKPTHVQLIVHKARNLKLKGKSGTNDCYATIHLGKEKYHTSIKEKCIEPEWNEECDFSLVEDKPSLKLCLYHRNFIGMDDFLGQTEISLDQFNAYERPRRRWFPLFCKASSKKQDRQRGEVELTAIFMVQNISASVCNLDRQKRNMKTLSFKNLSNNIGNRLVLKWPSKTSLGGKSDLSSGNFSIQSASQRSLETSKLDDTLTKVEESAIVSSSLASLVEEDSAVESKQASFESCTNSPHPSEETVAANSTSGNLPSTTDLRLGEDFLHGLSLSSPWKKCSNTETRVERPKSATLAIKSSTMNHSQQMALYELHEIEEYRKSIQKSMELHEKSIAARNFQGMFEDFSNEDLVHLVIEQRQQLTQKDDYIRDLEDYIDNLLVKVIESQPKLLQKLGKEVKEPVPLGSIMHYSTMPRSYSQAVPSAKPLSTTSHSNRKRHVQSFWNKGSFNMSPLKRLQSLMK